MSSNILKQKQLQLLLNEFELLGKTVLTQFQLTSKLLDETALDSIFEEAEANEIIIDRLELKVREEVVFTIFQFTPKAADLRKIITYQDITTNLERVGDMLLNIIHFLRKTDIDNIEFADEKEQVKEMLQAVGEMLKQSIQSFSNEDNMQAYRVIEADDKVDELYHSISRSLQTSFANKTGSLTKTQIRNILNVNSIAHNLERIGDSATNIAESTIYLTEGVDIRHSDSKKTHH
ncbi:MAG: phosphate signaling complex protein PhoU [Prevotellaceae bacterium]|jgi:phosphate transport system protein|nr:phosphate signaling complex protein PhoU [Prevotellaceae bacterium]